MKALAIVIIVLVLAAVFLYWADQKWGIGVVWRRPIMKAEYEGVFPYAEIAADRLETAACVDLGAFRKPLPDLGVIKTIVIMEDRLPEFFLSFWDYEPNKIVPLNRHGPAKDYITQKDLRLLIQELHNQKKKVIIGFWGYWGIDLIHKPTGWLRAHPELRSRRLDETDIGNPFVTLLPERITLTEYIARQYEKLHRVFGFDGLFLGDGLSGYRYVQNPARYRDKEKSCQQWAEFYRVIAEAVHKTGGKLWAYDCLGLNYQEARLHGADYRLLVEAGLNVLVFQSYPTAWVKYFRVQGKTGLNQDLENFKSIKQALVGRTNIEFCYPLELGDSVEGWWPKHKATRAQMKTFAPIADGKLLIWGNGTISSMGAK